MFYLIMMHKRKTVSAFKFDSSSATTMFSHFFKMAKQHNLSDALQLKGWENSALADV